MTGTKLTPRATPEPDASQPIHAVPAISVNRGTHRRLDQMRQLVQSRGFGHTAVAAMFLRLTSRGLSFASAFVLAHVLGVVEYGKYAYAISWSSILGVLAVAGFDRVLIRDIARYRTRQDWSSMKGLLRRSGFVVLATSMGVAIVAAAIGYQTVNSSLRPSFIIGCLLVPFAALTVARESVLQGLGKIQLGLLPEYVVLPLTLIALVGFARVTGFLSLQATSALALNLVACIFTLCIGIAMVRRCLPKELRHVPSRLTSSRWAGGAMSLAAISILGVVSTQLGAILLGSLSHPQDVGIYQVATRISQVLLFALIAVNMSLAPRAASLHTLGNTVELQRVTTHAVRASIAFSLPLATLLIVFRDPLLSIFGGHFGAGSTALIFLVLGQLFNAFMGPVGILLAMTGQERVMVITMAGCLLLQLALSVILIPSLGVEGAAIASMIGLIGWNAIFAAIVAMRLHLNPLPFSFPRIRHAPDS